MNNFYKVVMPGMLPYGAKGSLVPVHVGIKFMDGNLSITGVVGARSNGDCWGSCGQCTDALIDSNLVTDSAWTVEQVAQLHDVWDRWHLNDMNPDCEHQRKAGWKDSAKKEVTLYHWRMKSDTSKLQKEIKDSAIEAVKAKRTFTPTNEQSEIVSLAYSLVTHAAQLPENLSDYYEPKKSLYSGDSGHKEIKTIGWLSQSDHPEGILSKPCPECGYKYGSSWLREEVPEDVLEWILSLPESIIPCAWKSL